MQTQKLLARCAGPAIAAVLVLGSTPALAQQAGSVAAEPAPPPSANSSPLPTLVVPVAPVPATTQAPANSGQNAPATTPATTSGAPSAGEPRVITTRVQQPVVQQAPAETTEQEEAAVEEAAASPSAAAPAPAPSAEQPGPAEAAANAPVETAPAGTAPAESGETEAAIVPPPVPLPAPQAVPSPAAQSSAGEAQDLEAVGIFAIFASVLGVLGLAVLGLVAVRRRRRADVPQVERPRVAAKPRPAPTGETATTAAHGVAAPVVLKTQQAPEPSDEAPAPRSDIRGWAQPEPRASAPSVSQLREGEGEGGLPHAGASIALPMTAPRSPEAREALLRRMAGAKPDRANPFRSHKARRRRARLILQSLGHTFANGKSRIDFSQYPMNWPELAASKPVAA